MILSLSLPRCRLCGSALPAPGNLCSFCYDNVFIAPRDERRCSRCGKTLPLLTNPGMCPVCQEDPQEIAQLETLMIYEERGKEIIGQLKFQGKTLWLDLLVKEAASRIQDVFRPPDIIISAPSHRKRTGRGSPLETFAHQLSGQMKIPYLRCLKRTATQAQKKLSRRERLLNLKGKISIDRKIENTLRDKHILFVDDVMTTGATVRECSRVLKEAGVGRIDAFLWALDY